MASISSHLRDNMLVEKRAQKERKKKKKLEAYKLIF